MSDLVYTAEQLRQRRQQLENELEDLKKRHDLATRRLEAYQAEKTGDIKVWLGTPSEIEAMKKRLEAASKDENVLMGLVEELRRKRESLTNEALNYYAQKGDQQSPI